VFITGGEKNDTMEMRGRDDVRLAALFYYFAASVSW
jgi:hypothetical protein